MVDVPPLERLHQVDHPCGDCVQAFAELRNGFPQLPQHPFLETHAVGDHARTEGDLAQQLVRDLHPRVHAGLRQVFEVPCFLPFRVDAVEGVLERHLLVRPGPVEQRDGRAERLEVKEAERIPDVLEELPDLRGIRVRLFIQVILRLHPLHQVEGIERDILQLDDPLPVHLPRVDPPPPQGEDGMFGHVLPAEVHEVAIVWVAAVGSDVDLRHLAPEHLPHLGQRFGDGGLLLLHDSCDVLEDEQLLRDDVPLPHVTVVDVHEIRLVDGDSTPGEDVILDSDVVPVMLLH